MAPEPPARNPKPLVFVLVALLIFVVLPILVVAIFGGTPPVDEGLPEVGVLPVSVPFSAQGAESVTVRWQVRGGEAAATAVYFTPAPAIGEFTLATTPESAGYPGSVPGEAVTLEGGVAVYEASVPNVFAPLFVRIYAAIGDDHYWSQEFEVANS